MEFFSSHLFDRREDGDHRVVHPDIDRAKCFFHSCGCFFDFFCVGYVNRKHERTSSKLIDFLASGFEPIRPARDQTQLRTAPGKSLNCGAPHTGGRSSYDYDFRFLFHFIAQSQSGASLFLHQPFAAMLRRFPSRTIPAWAKHAPSTNARRAPIRPIFR